MRKLEALLNLPPAPVFGQNDDIPGPEVEESDIDTDTETSDAESDIEETRAIIVAADVAMDKIDIALPTVRDLDSSDKELDDIAQLATDTFTSLVDLSMNVEARFSGPILQSASTLLGHALTAKMAKMDKKLKMVDLQLKKARLDQQSVSKDPSSNSVEGKGTVIDRNDLLKSILAANVAEKGK